MLTHTGGIVQWQAEKRRLVIVSGFIHDVGDFVDKHPGGERLLLKKVGKDATAAFCGGVYDHGNAAHNVWIPSTAHFVRSTLICYMFV